MAISPNQWNADWLINRKELFFMFLTPHLRWRGDALKLQIQKPFRNFAANNYVFFWKKTPAVVWQLIAIFSNQFNWFMAEFIGTNWCCYGLSWFHPNNGRRFARQLFFSFLRYRSMKTRLKYTTENQFFLFVSKTSHRIKCWLQLWRIR